RTGLRRCTVPTVRPLEPGPHSPASWLVPALAAAGFWAVMAMAAQEPAATARSLVFIGGPLLLLAGLHARLFPYLHAPERLRLLPLPIIADRHWQAANRRHGPELAVTAALGCAALLAPDPRANWPLVVEFAWLVGFAWILEPMIAAVGAHYGRRFPEQSRAHELQRSLGGGWTTPEAVVHLYGPALGVATAALLAMPGQLGWERWIDGGTIDGSHVALGLVPLSLAGALRGLAPRMYRGAFWEAVPWLAEATRTVAGPARPEPSPGWVRLIRDPWGRVLAIQLLRTTPLPLLRGALLLGALLLVVGRSAPPSGPLVAAAIAVCGVWLVPNRSLGLQRPNRQRLAAALPLPASQREGRAGWWAILMWSPVLAVLLAVLGRLGLG
ncbi:MAG: hypothetical protein KC457_12155, partial [Myxococcales bacterium]|nr:hypothetical protein [Myxococcales bacterium]